MVVKGQKINERYEILKIIGEGGMANVYLAEDTILGRKVAVKVLRGDLANDEKFVRRFQREALAASSLNHPNIVEMYDVGEDDGDFYIVMEYIEGRNLKQLIKRRGALTIPEVIDIMLQLTDGLAHAHDAYIIHRDIKPQNILILDNGLVKITDFGIAMALNNSQLTQTNSVMGSVHYLPPEQASGKGSTIKSDLYSLGILMYELLTGKLPFRGESAVEIALKHMKDPLPSLSRELDNVPQSIENIIIRATAKNPKNRYNNAREMYEDVKTALDDERIHEPRYIYKYLEHDLDDTKILPVIKDDKGDGLIAKPITDDDFKPNKKIFIILGSILASLILLLFLIFIIIPAVTEVPDVRIPDVSNMTVEDAESKLKEAGFEVAIELKEISSDKIEEGNIVKTSPASGRMIKKGTTVTLYQSTGENLIEIENYIGKDYIEVKSALTLKGIKVIQEKKDVDDISLYRDKENIIIAQNIDSGSKLKDGDEIILYTPNIYEVYPDMVGEKWTVADAQVFADEYGFNLDVTYKETDAVSPGIIIYQSRPANSKIVTGFTLKIDVSKAKPVQEEPIEEEPINGTE
ncbi:MAG: Stk1 family PASTA domain-containing Ser/Thr kinase [Bacilli bacterium]|nr:Stk1 family PASTA domain-containing Ser/Thr kinase [Bacilli bacterium]MDD3305150.1 Stk1 family PASTA domain-containing Ser/Thr kinase [Bacilli bacterium]MDD4053666.1 Stk1 family PASTA domain-containing Ser/Thr kinase [Bacilli bacterium]MDD4411165.1 Stk1 family PASTA domain-containing Ser/Thr kinase [Bacilli bacterium]